MNKWSRTSQDRLYDCEKDLIELFNEVLEIIDCSVLTGYRDEKEQNEAFYAQKSKVAWPNSKHNSYPSKAVDVAPFPIDWNDIGRFYMFAGIVKAVAHKQGKVIRWGGDWDSDGYTEDQSFNDLVHFELL